MRLLLISILLLQFATGCNFVRLQERFMERSIKRSGLVKNEVQLGADKIAYWEGGKGPNLVMLHGFGADATFGWNEQIPELSKYFHLIVPDLLWFGRSDSSNHDYSVDHQAIAVKNLLGHLGVSKFNLMGLSYGGIVALYLAQDCPGQLQRLVIVDSPGPVFTHDDYRQILKRFQVQSVSEIVMPTTSEGLESLFHMAYAKPPYVPFFAKQNVIDFVKDRPTGERAALLDHVLLDLVNLRRRMKPLKEPVMLIWGSDDPLFPLELANRLKTYLGGNAQLKVIAGGKHTPNLEFGDEFNQLVVDFLK